MLPEYSIFMQVKQNATTGLLQLNLAKHKQKPNPPLGISVGSF